MDLFPIQYRSNSLGPTHGTRDTRPRHRRRKEQTFSVIFVLSVSHYEQNFTRNDSVTEEKWGTGHEQKEKEDPEMSASESGS